MRKSLRTSRGAAWLWPAATACRASRSGRPSAGVLKRVIAVAVVAGAALLAGCGEDGPPAAPSTATTVARATPITVATADRREIAVTLRSMGTLESVTAPTVSAEVDGRIVRLGAEAGERVPAGGVLAELDTTELELERQAASADIRSLQAQIENEQRRVARFESLKQQDYLAQTQLDDSRAQLEVLRAQTAAAQARLAIVEDKLARTTVRAPVAGTVERRRVSVGDFVRRGDPMFDLTADADLQAFLPFPETVSQVLRPGLEVTLASPIAPGTTVTGRVAELRPVVGRGSRAVTAIVPLRNPGPWRDQATVEAEVVVERRADAVVVPAGAVVRRPAGEVVYRVEAGRAAQRPVTLGVRVGDAVEVTAGLTGGEVVAVEGASYLTDGAPVRVTGPRP